MASIPGREDPEQKQFRRPPPGMSQKPRGKGPYPSQPARKKRRRMTPQEEQQAQQAGSDRLNNSGYYGRSSMSGGSGKRVEPTGFSGKGGYASQPMPSNNAGNKGGMRAAISRRMSR